MNSRCGDMTDYIEGVDNIPDRDIIDYDVNSHGDNLIDFLIGSNCCMLNGRNYVCNDFTRIGTTGRSVVDYCMIPYESIDKFSQFTVIRMTRMMELVGMTVDHPPDHSILKWCMDIGDHSGGTGSVNEEVYVIKENKKYDVNVIPDDFMNNANIQEQLHCTINKLENIQQNIDVIDGIYGEFCDLVIQEMDVKLPSRVVKVYSGIRKCTRKKRKKNQKWWCDELETMYSDMCEAESAWLSCPGGTQRTHAKTVYVRQCKAFNKVKQKHKRLFWKNEQNRLLDECENDPNKFWKTIGQIGIHQERKPRIPMETYDVDGQVTGEMDQVLKRWKDDFASLFKNNGIYDEPFLQSVKDKVQKFESEMENFVPRNNVEYGSMNDDITGDEVRAAILKAKIGKAMGVDNIPAEVLKSGPVYLFLIKLFNLCFRYGIVPSVWQRGIINPIPKSSDKDPRLPLSYRGITLTCHMYKMYCSILQVRLQRFLEQNKVLVEEQNGFRKMRSCLDHIFTLVTVIENRLKKRQSTYVSLVDMQKAFDTVNRTCLFEKLSGIGIHGKMYNAIKSVYQNVTSAVRVNGICSDWFEVENGVKQGCILSPTLFSIFVNDLAKEIKMLNNGIQIDDYNLSILLFADDIALISDTPESLQTMLDTLSNWCYKWRLSVNVDKTKVMHFRPPSVSKTSYNFTCAGLPIDVTDSYKYLGLTLNEHLDKNVIAKSVAKSAQRALGLLIAKHKALGGMPHEVFSKLYDSLVAPVIEYAAAIWGHREFSSINSVMNRACRYFMGVSKYTPNLAVHGDMGWKSSWHRQSVCITRLWLRLVNMDQNRIAYKVFKFSCHMASNGCKNWCFATMKMFDELGLDHLKVWENCINKHAVITEINDCLYLKTQSNWFENVNRAESLRGGSNKLRTYKGFKSTYETEMYLKVPMPFKVRQSFASLRCGTAPLRVETGRYENKPVNERLCELCDSGQIEDEIHFMTKCTAFTEERQQLYNNVSPYIVDFNQKSDTDRFLILMGNANICKITARACHEMLTKRRSILYSK